MEAFEYYNPVKVLFGEGKLAEIGSQTALYGQKALIVTYEKSDFFDSVIEKIHTSLEKNGVEWVDFRGVSANPLLCQAKRGVELCRSNGIDVLIALGGGSVMDCTKIIAAGALYPHDLEKMILFSHSAIEQIPPTESLPTLMIPTLPATGSEMNPTAVITDEKTSRKSYVWEPSCMYAKVAVMDPELTVTLPPYQTACGAFDIIAHVIEAYLNGDTHYDLSVQERMQEGVVRAVLDTLPVVWEHPDNLQARGALLWASSIALNGWLTSGTFGFTPMHQMGHVLSSHYNTTHGATLACMMPAWMRYFVTRPDGEKYLQLADRIFGCSLSEAADRLEKTIRSYGVQTR
ncbi:MAG: iron-containing alcohol dehydrogenase, partial [Clostridia bacterium]|nr:iron-containing alcohol dehydrogenase [Clostridia bacterium]